MDLKISPANGISSKKNVLQYMATILHTYKLNKNLK
jgi:hypothetical protein